jgi:uncharacterized protein DUF5995
MSLDTGWGLVSTGIAAALVDQPTCIADVINMQLGVQAALDEMPPMFHENPVSDFNVLYTDITKRILERYEQGGFNDPDFLNLLDVEFGRRYFDALRAWCSDSGRTPEVWQILFSRCQDERLRSLPCAVAGVNAHINYDLPFALLETWKQLGHNANNTPQHRDFLEINNVFYESIPNLRHGFLSRWQRCVDMLNWHFDDWYENLVVRVSRARAWDKAQDLWLIRDDPDALERERIALDRLATSMGEIVLSPFFQFAQ